QVLASSAKNLILFDNGLVLSFSTIVIAALLNSGGRISFTNEQASWFASITYLCQPVGSVMAGVLMEPLGRKKSMLALNLPFLAAWLLLHFAPNVISMYIGGAIMGLAVGCTEAPILTYVGEISEPRLRGVMTSYAQLFGALAYVALYALGSLLDWRTTALVCAAVPIVTFIAITQVPETPVWLLSKGRLEDAEKALCWLRGWVRPEAVRKELEELIEHHTHNGPALANNATPTLNSSGSLNEHSSFADKLVYLTKPAMRKPLGIIIGYFFFFYASGFSCVRPYMVPVFKKLQITMDPYHATVVISVLGLVGNAVCMCSVHYCGKRVLSLISFAFSGLSTLGLALVALNRTLPSTWALPMFLSLSFFNGLGAAPIPWMLQSELFPFRGRSLGSSVAAAISYLIGFVATKTFLNLEEVATLEGVFFIYTGLSFLAVLFVWVSLPETEGRSLHEIEAYFVKKS
ncbi:hypothetical protein AAG570_005144, partial [Ranatra chinensis]